MSQKRDIVIGIEIHAHILSQSKMFSEDSAQFSLEENQHIHPVSLGFPGTLPFLNKAVMASAIKVGQAFQCQIQQKSLFARKHYFYPDLPKGYQISQYDQPLLQGGFVEFFNQDIPQKVDLDHIHLEEDAGRLLHQKTSSLVDYNRAGMPLLEIVSKPEIKSPSQAADYSRMVRSVLLYLQVCDGNLQEGSMRFDCNISLRSSSSDPLGVKVELKNLNSFRFMKKALQFEIDRQNAMLDQGKSIVQETRLFDSKKGETFSMRKKEEASDYRYFPEPDLLPLVITIPEEKLQIELPFQKTKRFCEEYKLPLSSATILVEDRELCSYFEKALKKTQGAQTLCKWVTNEIVARIKLHKSSVKDIPVAPEQLAELVNQIDQKTLSSKMAKDLFSKMWDTGKNVKDLMQEFNLKRVDDVQQLQVFVDQVIEKFPEQCEQYKQGKETVYKFLMGQVMKLSKGQADPIKVDELLKTSLKNV